MVEHIVENSSESSEITGKARFDRSPTARNIANWWKLLATYDESIFVLICSPIALSQTGP